MTDRIYKNVMDKGAVNSTNYHYDAIEYGGTKRILRCKIDDLPVIGLYDRDLCAIAFYGRCIYAVVDHGYVVRLNRGKFMIECRDGWLDYLPCSVGEFYWALEHENWKVVE